VARPRTAEEIAALFGQRPGDFPTEQTIYSVLALLCHYGRNLPDIHRPRPSLRPWQRIVLRVWITYARTGFEGARQGAGKTMLAALYLTCCLILNHTAGIGMPTLEQASSILMKRALLYMRVLEPLLGMRRTMDNVRHVTWEHGAELRAMSTNEAGFCSTQGYTVSVLFLDEAHELKWASIGYYTPLVNVAMKQGRGKIIILGPAGPLDSAIERAKNSGYEIEVWNDEAISAMDDAWRAGLPAGHPELRELSWREVFEAEERGTDPITYNQFYRLLPVTAGGLLVLPNLRETSDGFLEAGQPTMRWTIDVGKIVDSTLIGRWTICGDNYELMETRRWHGVPYGEVAQQLIAYLDQYPWIPRHVGIEVTGPGEVLADTLVLLDPRFRSMRRIKTTDTPGPNRSDGRKTRWMKRLIWRNLRGKLGIREKNIRDELAPLVYSVGEAGRYDWPHSDALSVLFLNEAMGLTPMGV
jgi:hypothetical protein